MRRKVLFEKGNARLVLLLPLHLPGIFFKGFVKIPQVKIAFDVDLFLSDRNGGKDGQLFFRPLRHEIDADGILVRVVDDGPGDVLFEIFDLHGDLVLDLRTRLREVVHDLLTIMGAVLNDLHERQKDDNEECEQQKTEPQNGT